MEAGAVRLRGHKSGRCVTQEDLQARQADTSRGYAILFFYPS